MFSGDSGCYSDQLCQQRGMLDRYENICPELKDVIENIKAEYRNAVRIDLKKQVLIRLQRS